MAKIKSFKIRISTMKCNNCFTEIITNIEDSDMSSSRFGKCKSCNKKFYFDVYSDKMYNKIQKEIPFDNKTDHYQRFIEVLENYENQIKPCRYCGGNIDFIYNYKCLKCGNFGHGKFELIRTEIQECDFEEI